MYYLLMEKGNFWNINLKAANENIQLLNVEIFFHLKLDFACAQYNVIHGIVIRVPFFIYKFWNNTCLAPKVHSSVCFIKVDLRLCPSFIFRPSCVFKLAATHSTPPPDLVFMATFTVSQMDLAQLASQWLLFKNRPGVKTPTTTLSQLMSLPAVVFICL